MNEKLTAKAWDDVLAAPAVDVSKVATMNEEAQGEWVLPDIPPVEFVESLMSIRMQHGSTLSDNAASLWNAATSVIATMNAPTQQERGLEVSDKTVDLACAALAFAFVAYPQGGVRGHVSDWFELDAEDAVHFGVLKEPEWHGHSDIRGFQQEAYIAAVLREPMRAALVTVSRSCLAPQPSSTDSAWQDIATAPKDGTEFQAWLVNADGTGFWEPRGRINPDTGAFEMFGRVDYDEDGWSTYPHLSPTHWQPLPTPPKATP